MGQSKKKRVAPPPHEPVEFPDTTRIPEEENVVFPSDEDIPPEKPDYSPPPDLEDTTPIIDMAAEMREKEKEPEADAKDEPVAIELYFPFMHPVNGRIITIGYKMSPVKSESGLFLVPRGLTRDNFDRARSNPNEDMIYFIVSMCPTVNRNLRDLGMLPKHERFNKEMKLEIGDQIVVSPNMEPVYHRELDKTGLKEFWVWHYTDILGFRKDPGNLERFERNAGGINNRPR